MFKDMAADTYLASAGIASDWPYGRGCYVSEDKGFIVWVGEEDHLRIMAMKKGTVINDVFDRTMTSTSLCPGCALSLPPSAAAVPHLVTYTARLVFAR